MTVGDDFETMECTTKPYIFFQHYCSCISFWITILCCLFHVSISIQNSFYLKGSYLNALYDISYVKFLVWYWGQFGGYYVGPALLNTHLFKHKDQPDALLLLDFFQPTVNLLASSGLQLKLNVLLSSSLTSTIVNLLSDKCRIVITLKVKISDNQR